MRTRKHIAAIDRPFVTQQVDAYRRRRDVDVLFLRNKGLAEQEEDIGSASMTAPDRSARWRRRTLGAMPTPDRRTWARAGAAR
jgi:hypothetical protein